MIAHTITSARQSLQAICGPKLVNQLVFPITSHVRMVFTTNFWEIFRIVTTLVHGFPATFKPSKHHFCEFSATPVLSLVDSMLRPKLLVATIDALQQGFTPPKWGTQPDSPYRQKCPEGALHSRFVGFSGLIHLETSDAPNLLSFQWNCSVLP